MDDRGFLYITDIQKHDVKRWRLKDNNREGIVVAGGHGPGSLIDQLSGPTYVFVDGHHSVFVSDSNNQRVMKWVENAKDGILVAGGGGSGTDLSKFNNPRGVIVDHLGTIYVSDFGNCRIVRWPKGATQGNLVVGGSGPGDCIKSEGLSFDRYGNLYVSDISQNRVDKFQMKSSSFCAEKCAE
jgi:sugar lactone lactonase YvrE